MSSIQVFPNEKRNGFHIPNEADKQKLTLWLHKFQAFEITPVTVESIKARKYLHGAVEPSWCKWQYGIDPRDKGLSDQRHFLFMRDFNCEIIKNRKGDPERVPMSSRGKLHDILSTYTRYAEENGAPIPNPELYKLYRDKWRVDFRFPTYHDWLEFLHIEEDAMPSSETLNALLVNNSISKLEYPEFSGKPTI